MALAVESPRPSSFRAPVGPASADPRPALRLSAARRVDHKRPGLSPFLLALRPDHPRRAAWLEVSVRQAVHALFRLVNRQEQPQAARQVDGNPAVLALLRRGARPHRVRPAGVWHDAQVQRLCRVPAPVFSQARRSVQVLVPG